jgi:hypothetical protein
MSSRIMLLATALMAAACATAPAKVAVLPAVLTDSQGRNYRVVCRMERPTGSNIAEKVCRPELEDTEAMQRLQDEFRAQVRPTGTGQPH